MGNYKLIFKKRRGGKLELSVCQCRGIWPDGGSDCISSVRYTLINFSRLHQSYTSNSQNTNYREEAGSDSCWKEPN